MPSDAPAKWWCSAAGVESPHAARAAGRRRALGGAGRRWEAAARSAGSSSTRPAIDLRAGADVGELALEPVRRRAGVGIRAGDEPVGRAGGEEPVGGEVHAELARRPAAGARSGDERGR